MTDFSAIRDSYLKTTIGKKPPASGIASGAVLNKHFGETRYDPKLMYLVTKDGITPVFDDGI